MGWLWGGRERDVEVAGVDVGGEEFVPFGLGWRFMLELVACWD